jgi:paraquat-inducible protein B
MNAQSTDEFPVAKVREASKLGSIFDRSTFLIWLVTIACLAIAAYLSFRGTAAQGRLVTVTFRDGYGLKAEDSVLYRGIEVGRVEDVRLRDDLGGVDVKVRLRSDADNIATEGSQFWVERPQLSLSRLSGIDTVVGAKYLGVIPGESSGPKVNEFTGLEMPPTIRQSGGTDINIHFEDGFGIAAGSPVKFRGITIGEVTGVELDDNLAGVNVRARLKDNAASLAREGTTFWVERPKVNLKDGIRGLDTIVGGQYLAVQPGPSGGPQQIGFEGLTDAPAVMSVQDGGLLVTLDSEERFGLERGAPVTYRGMPAGQVTHVALARSGHTVEVTVQLFPDYVHLVRDNTMFWSRSGVDLHFGLKGFDLDVDPLTSLASGGIAFATPLPAGEMVATGHRFNLMEKEADGWQDWKPIVDVGKAFIETRPTPEERKERAQKAPGLRILDRVRAVTDALQKQD